MREGERVWAKDLRDGQWKLRHVMQTFEHMNDGVLLSVKVAGETIRVTRGHPFWVVQGEELESRPWPAHVGAPLAASQLSGRWVNAGELRVGDVLYLKSGEMVAIEEIERLEVWEKVYNFQVEELECYAVGNSEVLVHNSSTQIVTDNNGNVILKIFNKFPPGSYASRQLQSFVQAWNEEIAKAGGSMTRRRGPLTKKQERRSINWRRKLAKLPRFKGKAVGHTPDACAGGRIAGGRATALSFAVNEYLGGLLGGIPRGQVYNQVSLYR